MVNKETAWRVSIDYESLPKVVGRKANLARGRKARASIKAAGYPAELLFEKQQDALSKAKKITKASGVPMRVAECITCFWPA